MPYWDFDSWDFKNSFTGKISKKMANVIKSSARDAQRISKNIRKNIENDIYRDSDRDTRRSTGYKYNFDVDKVVVPPSQNIHEKNNNYTREYSTSSNAYCDATVKRKRRSSIPIYLSAITWATCAFCFPMYKIFNFAITITISLFVFVASSLISSKTVSHIEKKKLEKASRKNFEAQKNVSTGDTVADKVVKDSVEFLRQMDEADLNIINPTLSDEIRELEKIFKKMIAIIKDSPSKAPRIKSFMNYYIPATLKLLNYYDKLEEQRIDGENIKSSMESIEKAMKTIVKAFKKQLDSLFEDEAMDISTDISVLENMFSQEGLLEDDFKKEI